MTKKDFWLIVLAQTIATTLTLMILSAIVAV